MRKINLTKNKYTLVDDEDFRLLGNKKWFFKVHHSSDGYAARIEVKNGKRKLVSMHRLIMNCPDNFQVDHINKDKLDNRKQNLRICTGLQNSWNVGMRKDNKTGFRGVYKRGKKWAAYIHSGGKQIYLGIYMTPLEAAKRYNDIVKELHGSYSMLNKI